MLNNAGVKDQLRSGVWADFVVKVLMFIGIHKYILLFNYVYVL
jgi:hypothetical protein